MDARKIDLVLGMASMSLTVNKGQTYFCNKQQEFCEGKHLYTCEYLKDDNGKNLFETEYNCWNNAFQRMDLKLQEKVRDHFRSLLKNFYEQCRLHGEIIHEQVH